MSKTPYFRSPERIDALHHQILQWRGTRWAHSGTRPNQMRCGIEGDCLFWVHAFKAIDALPAHVTITDYRKMEAAGDKMQTLRTCIESTGRAQLIWANDPLPWPSNLTNSIASMRFMVGDVILFRNGMSGAHCGLVVRVHPTHFFHVSQNGAIEEPLEQRVWIDNFLYVYRLVEAEVTAEIHA